MKKITFGCDAETIAVFEKVIVEHNDSVSLSPYNQIRLDFNADKTEMTMQSQNKKKLEEFGKNFTKAMLMSNNANEAKAMLAII